jgi:hypothetical protein
MKNLEWRPPSRALSLQQKQKYLKPPHMEPKKNEQTNKTVEY